MSRLSRASCIVRPATRAASDWPADTTQRFSANQRPQLREREMLDSPPPPPLPQFRTSRRRLACVVPLALRVCPHDASVGDGELRLRLLEVGCVHDLDYAVLPAALAYAQADVRRVRKDVSSHCLLGVHAGEGHAQG
eukprot:CAMPEP_0198705786 /NCGR_PEP_ID=MMETSP1468-20131203/390603_1 /TAXON_ID=1461545 /ORGANISM="Mantoniella sp, Strain CCMP1436" /LENGTH=136 /DNA_ID=CAMNT_0044464669 /DNA_START=445 /DNA_END=855 /DNA_ORIENTATION=+